MKQNQNIHHGPEGIVVEILPPHPNGLYHAIIQIPRATVDAAGRDSIWRKDFVFAVTDLLAPMGYRPGHSWETQYDIAKRGWVVHLSMERLSANDD